LIERSIAGIHFIEYSCYDRINNPDTFDPLGCWPLSTTVIITASDYGIDSDICIVSVNELDGGAAIIDLSKPFATHCGTGPFSFVAR
jgi:hypothetical protein